MGVTGLETTGVSIEGVTGLDDFVCLEVSDPVLKEFKLSKDDCPSDTTVKGVGEDVVETVVLDNGRCIPRNNKYPSISSFKIIIFNWKNIIQNKTNYQVLFRIL